jgi:hypothetical protein
MSNLAETYRHLHRLEEARELHEQTLAARQRVLGPDDPDTLKSMDNLAETRHDMVTSKAPASCTSRLWRPAAACSATTTPTPCGR